MNNKIIDFFLKKSTVSEVLMGILLITLGFVANHNYRQSQIESVVKRTMDISSTQPNDPVQCKFTSQKTFREVSCHKCGGKMHKTAVRHQGGQWSAFWDCESCGASFEFEPPQVEQIGICELYNLGFSRIELEHE